jgi:uncharacterized membrane protein YhaH (DUF805 family)
MDFMTAVKTCFSKYATFSGRASRSEFWWFVLFNLLVSIVLAIIDAAIFGVGEQGTGPLGAIYSLAVFLPGLSVTVRRLHDTDRSGWWWWIILIPLVGFLVLLWFLVTAGTPGTNRFGPDPLRGRGAGDDMPAGPGARASSIPSVRR